MIHIRYDLRYTSGYSSRIHTRYDLPFSVRYRKSDTHAIRPSLQCPIRTSDTTSDTARYACNARAWIREEVAAASQRKHQKRIESVSTVYRSHRDGRALLTDTLLMHCRYDADTSWIQKQQRHGSHQYLLCIIIKHKCILLCIANVSHKQGCLGIIDVSYVYLVCS